METKKLLPAKVISLQLKTVRFKFRVIQTLKYFITSYGTFKIIEKIVIILN
jgi:hypothetical protein